MNFTFFGFFSYKTYLNMSIDSNLKVDKIHYKYNSNHIFYLFFSPVGTSVIVVCKMEMDWRQPGLVYM